MKHLFKSRIFKRLFYSYIIVILTSLTIYTAFLVYENNHIKKLQIEHKAQMQLDEASSIMDRYLLSANNTVQNLNYSTALKQLYMNYQLGTKLDPYSMNMIQREMKNAMASGDLTIYKIIIFLEGSEKAYSSGGVINVDVPFKYVKTENPYLVKGSLNDQFGFGSNRFSFKKECLIYCDNYTYQNGSDIGNVVILFDIDNLSSELKKILEMGYDFSIISENTKILSTSTDGALYTEEDDDTDRLENENKNKGDIFEASSKRMDNLCYQIIATKEAQVETDVIFYVFLCIIGIATIVFVIIALQESWNYYKPIGHINQIVNGENIENEENGGMEGIINGIRDLIGEKNIYQEKMLTISPYAKTGMLHSVMTGNIGKENIQILSEKNYFDLIKPFYMVSVANFSFDLGSGTDIKLKRDKLKNIVHLVSEIVSSDEITIVDYFRDMEHVFFIVNSETENIPDEIFYQLQKTLTNSLAEEGCVVTLGVDKLEDDINELQEACKGAVKALDGILTDGRGEVYFFEETAGSSLEHYFPNNFRDKLKKYLEKGSKEDISNLLEDIYDRNWKLAGAPEMYRALIDELHLSIIKTLRELTKLNITHVNIEKFKALATLREVFDYYEAALYSVVDSLYVQETEKKSSDGLEKEILMYIDDNIFDQELSLQNISDKFEVSNKYLSLLCKKYYGVTYLQYIQNRRIEKATILLSEGKYSLSEIAGMCGYANQLTFRRNFKSIKGINPSDYE